MDHYHGVLLPGVARLSVADATPEIDDLLAADQDTACSTQFVPLNKVLGECIADSFKTGADVTLNSKAI